MSVHTVIFNWLIVFILSSIAALGLVMYKRNWRSVKVVFPVFFIFSFALHVIPFVINCSVNYEIGYEIYPHLESFIQNIPYSIFLCSIFILLFSCLYRFAKVRIPYNRSQYTRLTAPEKRIILMITLISGILLWILTRDTGGMMGLILKGYNVTEVFIGKGHLVNSIGWLTSVILLLSANAFYEKKSKKMVYLWIGVFAFVFLIFAVMGRRGDIVYFFLAMLFLYNYMYRSISIFKMGCLLIGIFIVLNIVGLTRTSNYGNLTEVAQSYKKNEGTEGNNNLFYVLTTGQFAHPYISFPHMISVQGKDYHYGLGKYTLTSFCLLVPNILWKDRPLAMTQWYAKEYLQVEKSNQGRQFFSLAVAYMDFGFFGILLYGLILAMVLKFLTNLYEQYKEDVLVVCLVAIIFSYIFGFVTGDIFSFFIVLVKGSLFPIVILLMYRAIFEKNKYIGL